MTAPSYTKLRGRVAAVLGLELNTRLVQFMPSRIEYGYADDIYICFEIFASRGSFTAVTEDVFTKHVGARQIGIFGRGNPVEALRLLLQAYPDATVLMRRDGSKRGKRRAL